MVVSVEGLLLILVGMFALALVEDTGNGPRDKQDTAKMKHKMCCKGL
jgi:hypothetical protein